MHILVIPSWYPTQPADLNGVFFREQAQGLRRSGQRVGIIAPQFRSLRNWSKTLRGPYGREYLKDDDLTTLFDHNLFLLPRVPHVDLRRWVQSGLALFSEYIKTEGTPDLIHAHCLVRAGVLANLIHNRTGIPYCVTEHSSSFARGRVREWQLPEMRRSAASSAARFAVSRQLATLLSHRFGGTSWEVLPNMLSPIFQAPVDFSARDATTVRRLGAVAVLKKNKGIDVLLKAFAQVVAQIPDLQLDIGGDGPERASLEQLAYKLGIRESVRFRGALSRHEVRELMSESYAFVLSSHAETFGIVVIEALSQGTPVIATRCGGPESTILDGDGILVRPADPNELAQAILSVTTGASQFDRQAIRESCLDRFGEAAVSAQLVQRYEAILQGTARNPGGRGRSSESW